MFEIILACLIACVITFTLVPWLGRKLREAGIFGYDVHKKSRPKLPEMGGIAVVIGFFSGFILILFIHPGIFTVELSAALIAILGAAFVGMLDDLINLKQRIKALLPFLFGLPLALVITDTTITIPLVGSFELGLVMIILIPFAITSAANVTNMLEGVNGLSAGLGIIICIALGMIAILKGAFITLILIMPLLGALVAFLYYNAYPAKIFPGDSLTLFTGATIATAAILGDLEFFGALLFIPMILEFLLKFHGRFTNDDWPDSFGTPDERGILHYQGRVQSLTHWYMKNGRYREWELVLAIWLFQFMIGALVLILYFISSINFTIL